jgi:hypothetical protein
MAIILGPPRHRHGPAEVLSGRPGCRLSVARSVRSALTERARTELGMAESGDRADDPRLSQVIAEHAATGTAAPGTGLPCRSVGPPTCPQ